MQLRAILAAYLVCTGSMLAFSLPSIGAEPDTAITPPVDYERDVRPILSARCLNCHGPDDPEAGLDLTSRQSAVESGAIIPEEPAASTLLMRIEEEDDSLRMPPDGKPLTPDQIERLKAWVRTGADWPRYWAYRPLKKIDVPEARTPELRRWCETPIDRFIAHRLQEEGLKPSLPADRLTLLRRVSFDVRGLPPTPEEIQAFLNDDAPDAWAKCVERMLASPHYGERWARHWMDLVHFAETHGHDQDRPREHAWPYRDYLIRSFNSDKPYARFITEQVAGDVIDPLNPEAIRATGFLAAGPWDESSLRDIQENSLDRVIGQYLDRDDIVTTVMSTFASTSVHCARCHDHKFDPIAQEEYYSLQAVFAGIDKSTRAFDADPTVASRRTELHSELVQLEKTYAESPESLLTPTSKQEVSAWEAKVLAESVLWRPLSGETFISEGGATLELQEDASFLATGTRPEKDVYVVEGQVELGRVTAIRLEVLTDETLPKRGPGRQDNGNLHLNELVAFQLTGTANGERRPLSFETPHADFNQEGWTIAAAVDENPNTAWGIFPEVSKSHAAVFPLQAEASGETFVKLRLELHQTHGGGHLIGRFRLSATDADPERLNAASEIPFDVSQILATPEETRSEAQQTQLIYWFRKHRIESERSRLPPQQFVYAGTNQFQPDGSFRPTASPREVHVLRRGLITEPLKVARPGTLACIEELAGEFDFENENDEGTRRQKLAAWLSDHRNPLVWRSIANRVWQYHFGRGLVDTPNDFGQMGGSPTHPELLDWLAVTLLENNGSLKGLHRLILNSAVYRQGSEQRTEAAARDAGNRLLWRMNRHRLDAESFRDALLVASGTLDAEMEGPSERQFIQTPGNHVTPNVDYQHFDVDDPANYRRSVYRFIFRTIPDPFMEALDCPDASQLTPERNVSLTALQALATLNDKFVVRQSELLACRLQRQAADVEQQVVLAYGQLFGRKPSGDELRAVVPYATEHGLANACRFLFNTNEFFFVD